MECLNVFSELLGIFGGLIILAYQSCQIFTSPPPKKKKHHLCIFWYSKVKISHILVAKGREIIKVVKDLGIIFLYSYMKALFRR